MKSERWDLREDITDYISMCLGCKGLLFIIDNILVKKDYKDGYYDNVIEARNELIDILNESENNLKQVREKRQKKLTSEELKEEEQRDSELEQKGQVLLDKLSKQLNEIHRENKKK
jgi:hypothetical protein